MGKYGLYLWLVHSYQSSSLSYQSYPSFNKKPATPAEHSRTLNSNSTCRSRNSLKMLKLVHRVAFLSKLQASAAFKGDNFRPMKCNLRVVSTIGVTKVNSPVTDPSPKKFGFHTSQFWFNFCTQKAGASHDTKRSAMPLHLTPNVLAVLKKLEPVIS